MFQQHDEYLANQLGHYVNIANRWHQLAINKMNFTTLHMDIQLIIFWGGIAYLQHQIQQGIIGVQIAALKLKQPNLDLGFLKKFFFLKI